MIIYVLILQTSICPSAWVLEKLKSGESGRVIQRKRDPLNLILERREIRVRERERDKGMFALLGGTKMKFVMGASSLTLGFELELENLVYNLVGVCQSLNKKSVKGGGYLVCSLKSSLKSSHKYRKGGERILELLKNYNRINWMQTVASSLSPLLLIAESL